MFKKREKMPVEDMQLDSEHRELKEAIDRLAKVVGELILIFKTANADIHSEADNNIGSKLDMLISQNQEIAKALLVLVEIQNEHRISRQVEKPVRRVVFPDPMPKIQPSINSAPARVQAAPPVPPRQQRPPVPTPIQSSPPFRFGELEPDDDEKRLMRFRK